MTVHPRIVPFLCSPEARDLALWALERGVTLLAVEEGRKKELESIGRVRLWVVKDSTLEEEGRVVALRSKLSSPKDQSEAMRLLERGTSLLVRATDWKVVPLENLVAISRSSGAHVLFECSSLTEARTALLLLERGVDTVLLEIHDSDTLEKALRELVETPEPVPLKRWKVTRVEPIGMGDRVLVDTSLLLDPEEGLLVGSSSSSLFLVASEALPSGYIPPRPFRVNAGAVHSYTLLPSGRTKYLSELEAGDEVLVVRKDGSVRIAHVGRLKIERRPLVLVGGEGEGSRGTILLQNAETVRLLSPQGPISVSNLKVGDEILVRTEEHGRHAGRAIRETILER